MYRLNQIKLNIYHDENSLKRKIAKSINLSVDDIDWSTLIILHRSIDARDKKNILYVYNVAFDFVKDNEGKESRSVLNEKNKLEIYTKKEFSPIVSNIKMPFKIDKVIRPIVVGFGPAGIFASYIFALNGLNPIIIERGKAIEDRIKDTEKFFDTLELDENSNVCFGEGGAGAFSDGKLNTNNKDRTGIYHFVLETFVKFGADEKILYDSMPHIGTDKLLDVIKSIRNEIIRLGGEIHYSTKFSVKEYDNDGAPVVLAIGNSSRDTFRELVECGFDIKAKPIAVGYRIAHRQSLINKVQYGDAANTIGPATYKLIHDIGNGHSVYSFCMCPGGYIINSSNVKGKLSINGMSYNDRGGKYANSAIVETINPSDIVWGSYNSPVQSGSYNSPVQSGSYNSPVQSDSYNSSMQSVDPLQMVRFQELVERAAFELEKGYIPYITDDGNAIRDNEVFKGKARYCEKLKTVYENCGLKFNINKDIDEALRHFNKMIPGFFGGDFKNLSGKEELKDFNGLDFGYVLAGVETRTSSPVKLDRDENFMCNISNFYPCGEGLGHGGGIMSCAVDGVNVAKRIADMLINQK